MPIEVGEDKFYTVEELCQKFNVSPVTVYAYIRTGKLPAKRFGKRYQISESVLGKFLTGVEDSAVGRGQL